VRLVAIARRVFFEPDFPLVEELAHGVGERRLADLGYLGLALLGELSRGAEPIVPPASAGLAPPSPCGKVRALSKTAGVYALFGLTSDGRAGVRRR